MKRCPECGEEIEDGMKFCCHCGALVPQKPVDAEQNSSGIAMGDKNVVAGDVVGKKEDYHVSGNATFVTNQDESKKMVRCHVCGKNIMIAGAFTCPTCGEMTCADCYDKAVGQCVACARKTNSKKDAEYRELLKKVYADGRVELAERRELNELRERLGLSNERASTLEREFRNKGRTESNALTRMEEGSLKSAEEILYGELDAEKALKEAEPVYLRHKENEHALSVYLTSLMMVDRGRAAEAIRALPADFESGYAASFDLAMMTGDYLKAEQVLQTAADFWPESEAFKFRRIEFQCSLFFEHGDKAALDEAEQAVVTLDESDDKVANSWRYYLMRLVSMFRGDEIPFHDCDAPFDDEDFDASRMFDALSHGRVGGFMSVDIRKIYANRFGTPAMKVLEINKAPIWRSEYCALKYLASQQNPIAMVVLGDCLLAADGTDAWFGLRQDAATATSNYREAITIMEQIMDEDESRLPAQCPTGIDNSGDGYGYDWAQVSFACSRYALCKKDGIGCARDRMRAAACWENFLKYSYGSFVRMSLLIESSGSSDPHEFAKEDISDVLKFSLKI